MVRYCDYERDAECQCVYCHKPRSDPMGYLCDACLTNADVAHQYDYRHHEFRILEHA